MNKKTVSFLENDSEKILQQSQSAVERDQLRNKIGLQIQINFKVRDHCFVSNITNEPDK